VIVIETFKTVLSLIISRKWLKFGVPGFSFFLSEQDWIKKNCPDFTEKHKTQPNLPDLPDYDHVRQNAGML